MQLANTHNLIARKPPPHTLTLQLPRMPEAVRSHLGNSVRFVPQDLLCPKPALHAVELHTDDSVYKQVARCTLCA